MKLIVTRPEHDITTRFISRWSELYFDMARKKSIEICDLKGNKATKKELIGRLKKLNPELVILNGHGGDDCIAGHENEVLIRSGENENVLKSRVTYAISCNSAKVLGNKFKDCDKTAYIGYSDKFIFTLNFNNSTRPLKDERAKPFMESSNHVIESLLKGHTAKEASDRSKSTFKKNFIKLLSSNSDPDAIQDAQFLWWDMRHQVCIGNGDKKL